MRIIRKDLKRPDLGKIDRETFRLGKRKGIDLTRGSVRKKDRRVIIVDRALPKYGFASKFVLRSRVVWWLRTGQVLVGDRYNLHHLNSNRSDDRFSNLEKIGHKEHAHEHNPFGLRHVKRRCKGCRKPFKISRWRVRGGRGHYCTHRCSLRAGAPSRKKQGKALSRYYQRKRA